LFKQNTLSAAHSELYHANGTSGYDGLNRLTDFSRGALSDPNSTGVFDTVASPTQTIGYNLDTEGNWSGLTLNGTTTSRTHDAQNKLTAIGTGAGAASLSYDAGGYQTNDGASHALTYDAWGRLKSWRETTSGGSTVSYTYDAAGRRISRIQYSGSTFAKANYYTYTSAWQVATETTTGSANDEMDFVWSPVYVDAMVCRDVYTDHDVVGGGGGEELTVQYFNMAGDAEEDIPTEFILPAGTYLTERTYVRQDANWNTTSVYDQRMYLPSGISSVTMGLASLRYEYEPYGTVTPLSDSFTAYPPGTTLGKPFEFLSQGRRQDPTTGLIYSRNRDYNAVQGRWIQPDPAGYVDGANIYQPEGSDPVGRVDPSGLYDQSGHFYTTFIVAIAAGKTPAEAYDLAYYSQLPDQIQDFDAKYAGERIAVDEVMLNQDRVARGNPDISTMSMQLSDATVADIEADLAWRLDVQRVLHSLHGGPAAPRQACLQKLLKSGSLSPMEQGLVIHALADSFAHTTGPGRAVAYGDHLGHALDSKFGTDPDIIGNDTAQYKEYTAALFSGLGGKATNPVSVAAMSLLFSFVNTFAGSSDAAGQMAAMAKLARSVGYRGTFVPNDGSLDPAKPTPTREQVQALLRKIKAECNCN
jgi:RHS repeat-associated protein